MVLPIAPDYFQALKGLETRIASKSFLLTDLITINEALGGPITDHHRQLMSRSIYSVSCLHQVEDQVKKFPQTKEKMYAYYGLPLNETARDLGLQPRTLKAKAYEFDKLHPWPAPSTPAEVRVCSQFFDGEEVSIDVTMVPRGDRFKKVRATLLGAFQNKVQDGEKVMLFMVTNGVRYGPIRNTQGWNFAVSHPDNVHRVCLYITNQDA